MVQNNTTDKWQTINLLKDPSYLYEKIREFCLEEYRDRDLVCPEPSQRLK